MWRFWRKRRAKEEIKEGKKKDWQVPFQIREFTNEELKIITMNFQKVIGTGESGTVYYGRLEDGSEVAVKMMNSVHSSAEEGCPIELLILSQLRHKNLISPVGYCNDGDKLAMVYEYMPRNLSNMLLLSERTSSGHPNASYESARPLSWEERLQIAIDVAQGLDYLHNICSKPIIHRNVKAESILLGKNLDAKLVGFRLARFLDRQTEAVYTVLGKMGHLDPEYMLSGKSDRSTDVYSFGVVLFMLITGRPTIYEDEAQHGTHVHIVKHIGSRIAGGASVSDIADPWLQGEYDTNSVRMVMDLGNRCTAERSIARPTITKVVIQLRASLALEIAHRRSKSMYIKSTNSSCNMRSSTVGRGAAHDMSFESHQSDVDQGDTRLTNSIWNTDEQPFETYQFNMDHGCRLLPFESHQFTYMELERITKKFTKELGKGGSGTVYYGSLENGTEVAVKKLSSTSKQGSNQFLAEVSSSSQVRHRNLVSLVGYCNDSACLALVYEYMPGGRLEDHLRGKASIGRSLSWAERLRIALDAARGLDYLHNGLPEPIIHRDVKTNNILLGQNLEAKVSDFGLSKTFDRNKHTHVSAEAAFTPGYLDPEFCNLWRFSEKTDVYSFGVVLLEIITGEPPISRLGEVVHIVQRVELSLKRGNIHDIADTRLQGEYDLRSVWKVVNLAMVCTARASTQRPTMTEIVVQLRECLALETAHANSRNTDNGCTDSTMFVTAR